MCQLFSAGTVGADHLNTELQRAREIRSLENDSADVSFLLSEGGENNQYLYPFVKGHRYHGPLNGAVLVPPISLSVPS